jgi:NitT/TauT family transport system ATP-binding protein
VLRIHGVTHTYPSGTVALGNVDIDIEAGEFVSIIGPSGCGKSTLLRLIAGLEAPTSGTISRDLTRPSRSPIAYVFQQPTLMPWTSVLANVRLPLDLEGIAPGTSEPLARRALARVGIADFAEALPRELSGGMQMRASIARALVTEPSLLLMDEPFGALDEITRGRLDRELLAVWAEQRLTAVFVTHSLHEAVFLSNRVLVMTPRPGRIADVLTVDEPHPRDESFRLSTRFADLCAQLSRMLVSAGSA